MSEVAKQWWPSTIYAAPEETIEPLHIVWINKEEEDAELYVLATEANTLQYCYDKVNWVNASSGVIFGNQKDGSSEYHVYIRRRSDLEPTTALFSSVDLNNKWAINGGQARISGNIMSLLGQDEELGNSAFAFLFYNNSNLIDASGLEMPAMTLVNNCYSGMFYNCTALTTAPALPATTMAPSCYQSMFYGCTALTSVPTLPAMEMKSRCYSAMFYGCTALTNVPVLPATALAEYCYQEMFRSCIALTSVPDSMLPATTMAPSCYQAMFRECAALATTPALPATTLAEYCYGNMFLGCTSLTSIPDSMLPATILAARCYSNMFYGCTALTNVPELRATTMAPRCYNSMFVGCTSLTSIRQLPEMAMPTTVMAESCWESMFQGCSGINDTVIIHATVLAARSCRRMFYGCGKLTQVAFRLATDISAIDALDQCLRDTAVGTTGTLYVSSAMLKSWKTDGEVPNNWSIVAL